MLNTLVDIERRLKAGEDSLFEFTQVVVQGTQVKSPDAESFASELVAFANADGGVILLGVDDHGVVRGLPDAQLRSIERWIIRVATEYCRPSIRPVIHKERLTKPDGGVTTVILVDINRGLFVHATCDGKHYQRIGSTKRVLVNGALARQLQERRREFVFDCEPVPTATLEDIDHRKLKRFLPDYSVEIPWLDLLRNMNIAAELEDNVIRPTVAGLLAFGKAPTSYLPSACIDTAVYWGALPQSDKLVHAERFNGCVDVQIRSAVEFVERFILKSTRQPTARKDYAHYNISAVRESIVNAVAHRDYSMAGSRIRLLLFADRLEIHSPGRLPGSVKLETMAYRVFTRNQLLVNFLSRMKYPRTGRKIIKTRGDGVQKILINSKAHTGRTPKYKMCGDVLVLTIWAKPTQRDVENQT